MSKPQPRRPLHCANGPLTMLYCAVLAGCAAHPPRSMHDRAREAGARDVELEPFSCGLTGVTPENRDALQRAWLADKLEFPGALDYMRIGRSVSGRGHSTFAERGEPCRAAVEPETCRTELAALEAKAYAKPQVFAITNTGDDVELLEGEQILARVGEISTPERAWLVLMVRAGFGGLLCGDAFVSSQRQVADGFELGELRTKSTCRPFERVRATYRVARDGTTKRIEARTVERDPDRCMVRRAQGHE